MSKEIVGQPRGKIYSVTRLERAFAPTAHKAFAPYYLALVDLDCGVGMTVRMTDIDPDEEPEIGDEVELVTRRLFQPEDRAAIVYGSCARLVL